MVAVPPLAGLGAEAEAAGAAKYAAAARSRKARRDEERERRAASEKAEEKRRRKEEQELLRKMASERDAQLKEAQRQRDEAILAANEAMRLSRELRTAAQRGEAAEVQRL